MFSSLIKFNRKPANYRHGHSRRTDLSCVLSISYTSATMLVSISPLNWIWNVLLSWGRHQSAFTATNHGLYTYVHIGFLALKAVFAWWQLKNYKNCCHLFENLKMCNRRIREFSTITNCHFYKEIRFGKGSRTGRKVGCEIKVLWWTPYSPTHSGHMLNMVKNSSIANCAFILTADLIYL